MTENARHVPVWVRSALFIMVVPASVAGWIPWYAAGSPPLASRAGLPLAVMSAAMIVGGWTILLVCAREFARVGRGTPGPYDPPRSLVTSGMYRFSRNPMYVGVVTAIFGQALWFHSRDVVFYGVAMAVAFHITILIYEEPRLNRVFGVEYRDYRRAVPRWIGFRRGAERRVPQSR
jgi:protein-S-isoprenylcysteine O-methyltransferase Ste14